MPTITSLLHVVAAAAVVPLAPVLAANSPQVKLDQGVFTGLYDGQTSKFLGIPFANPPSVYVMAIFAVYMLTS